MVIGLFILNFCMMSCLVLFSAVLVICHKVSSCGQEAANFTQLTIRWTEICTPARKAIRISYHTLCSCYIVLMDGTLYMHVVCCENCIISLHACMCSVSLENMVESYNLRVELIFQ